MSGNRFYNLCNQHMNKAVEIRCLDGTVHRGIVKHVDQQNVYLAPLNNASGGQGPGLYFWGWGWGWGFPVALASIAALTALAFW
ncbi:hypothetical protein JOD43_001346 [Pullulanibacillus pueri]|uniref:LSM domain-containing protein n=1 Tax=Pullulanibacillus pueri TaxID=1437324 RepID=A0A8J2ZTW5_9BACL|nr:hypothetical protein [Pullulanibacillus pueri]MBM7681179.1 hypothetical protein [Pullulanibacillus pueri]GGH77357.1 hypothetical protein GCM10007096_09140 [Pullulanibacillus pueri]